MTGEIVFNKDNNLYEVIFENPTLDYKKDVLGGYTTKEKATEVLELFKATGILPPPNYSGIDFDVHNYKFSVKVRDHNGKYNYKVVFRLFIMIYASFQHCISYQYQFLVKTSAHD